MFERKKVYSGRALKAAEGSAERKKYTSLAVKEYDALLGRCTVLFGTEGSRFIDLRMSSVLYMKAHVLTLLDEPESVIELVGQFETERFRTFGLEWWYRFDVKCWQAEAYTSKGQYFNAISVYTSVQDEALQYAHLGHVEKWVIGMIRCHYETGDHDFVIEKGGYLLKKHRQLPGAHKYVAYSLRAKGDIEAAKDTMSRAILYEQPWNVKNRELNQKILIDFNNPEGNEKKHGMGVMDLAHQLGSASLT